MVLLLRKGLKAPQRDWGTTSELQDLLFHRYQRVFDKSESKGKRVSRVVYMTDKAMQIDAELPGLEEKDVDVSLSDDVLTIKGETRSEKEEKKKLSIIYHSP